MIKSFFLSDEMLKEKLKENERASRIFIKGSDECTNSIRVVKAIVL